SQHAQSTRFSNLSIIPAANAGGKSEAILAKKGAGLYLDELLKHQDEYQADYVLFDCSPTVNIAMINALVASDLLLIPMQTDHLSFFGLDAMLATLMLLARSKQHKRLP